MEYNFRDIEKKWQEWWKANKIYQVSNASARPKCYVLDMFPYPSGAGLHVGHPLGYIASDIYSRYKRLKGFNVLHPMGYDAFGLPAEQYAIEQGIHPALSTEKNISNFRKQLDNIGFCFDWDREIRTSDPHYYKWTQWIFLQLFDSWFNPLSRKAERIKTLISIFEKEGNQSIAAARSMEIFTKEQWKAFDEKRKMEILMDWRLAYCGFGEVNWCEALGTVLANDEVINGVSERGGYPVVKKKLRQWYMRITAYAERLLEGLQKVDFSESMKEMQSNWIGKSEGAEIEFQVRSLESGVSLRVYTTRPDTIFGVDFMVLAPEHDLIKEITSAEQSGAVDEYLAYVKSRSERDRMAEKKISGVFTGAYAINPFNGREIPIWVAEYVLAGYGTGAIMGVPCGDERDHRFARHYNIPITNIIGSHYNGEDANPTWDAKLENSDFLNGIEMRKAGEIVMSELELSGRGKRKVNYKMHDAAFSRQRYWGEPIPITWKDGVAYPLDEKELPLELPYVENYKPGPEGEGPLANIPEWTLIPNPSPRAEKGAARVPKYSIRTPIQYELAKLMRKEHTEAEGKLWDVLRGNKLGAKFRRQHPIDAYIVDFVSLQERLIIEADGGYHNTEEQKKYDEERTARLNDIGFKVLRFSNYEILNDPESISSKIKSELGANAPSPQVERGQGVRETNTMPGYAGSSWYFLRYMDPHNNKNFCDRKVSDYWNQVDIYVGGTEHAVGHLLYSRMWTKALYDLGYIGYDEPYKKLVNQGMIQGSSRFVYRVQLSTLYADKQINSKPIFVSAGIKNQIRSGELSNKWLFDKLRTISNEFDLLFHKPDDIPTFTLNELHVDVNIVDGVVLDIEAFRKWRRSEFADAFLICEDGSINAPLSARRGEGGEAKYICGSEVEKMSKSKFNTINPNDLVSKYGADTFRMYEMFLGPLEMSKPWDTKGIEGVHRFLKKFWRLFIDENKGAIVTDEKANEEELKVLHKAIKKIGDDTEKFNFNTAVSAFMIATNELTDQKSHKRALLEPLLILLAPYAPHISEELWHLLGNKESIVDASYPAFNEEFVKELSKNYPVAINGKTRTELTISLNADQKQVEEMVLSNEIVKKWLEGKTPKKVIYVKNKMINVVV